MRNRDFLTFSCVNGSILLLCKSRSTRIISGIFFCCEVKANEMLDKKPQPVAIIRFVACSFFLWFDLPSDWSCVHGCWICKVKLKFLPHFHYPISNQSVHGFLFRTVKQIFSPTSPANTTKCRLLPPCRTY